MKLIMDNLVYSASATNANPAYPEENLYDEHPQKCFKALSSLSTLKSTVTINSYGDCNGLAIINTNATQVGVKVTTSDERTGVSVLLNSTFDMTGVNSIIPLMHDIKARYKDLWIDYQHAPNPVTIELNFYLANTTETILYCGVVVNGLVYFLPNPQYGLNESLIDTSVIKWTSNKSLYYKKRDVIRKYNGSLILDRDKDLFFLMKYIVQRKGPAPMAWAMTDEDNQAWIVYGTMADSMPSVSHEFYKNSSFNFSIQEVI